MRPATTNETSHALATVVLGLTTAWLGFEAARAVTREAVTSGAAR